MLSVLVEHPLVLDPISLVVDFQGSQNPSPAVHLLENPEYLLLDLIGQVVSYE